MKSKEKQYTCKSVSMLVTRNGYCVKIETVGGKPICFFVDNDFNHIPWKLTITKGIVLDQREFWRLRNQLQLREISLNEKELAEARKLGKKVLNDPYFGLTNDQREFIGVPIVAEKLRPTTPLMTVVRRNPFAENAGNLIFATGFEKLLAVTG